MTTHESDTAPSRRAARRGDEQDARVVAMLQDLAPQLDAEPDPEYLRTARQRLVAMAAVRTPEPVRPSPLRRLLAGRAVDAPAGRWRTRATAGLAGAALTVTSLAALVALSTGAGPGDVLYGVKRGTEQTQLALAGDSRGQALLDLARTRLQELDDLDGDDGLARSTLATMDDQTTEGASWYFSRALDTTDAAPLDRLSSWTSAQSAQLESARPDVPPGATDDVAASLGLLAAITERADGLRGALDCSGGPVLAGTDELGPVPTGCRPEATTPQSPATTADPGSPVEGNPPPEAVPSPPAVEPTAPPADPTPGSTADQPAPVPPQLPGPPPAATTTPGGEIELPAPLPDLPLPNPLPSLVPSTVPTVPTTPPSTASPTPALDVPLDLDACLELPRLLRLGRC